MRRTGQVIERGKGTWLVRVFLGRDENGKKRYHSKTIRGTKKKATTYLSKLITQSDEGTIIEPSQETLIAYMRTWLNGIVRGRVRERTRSDYADIVDKKIATSKLAQVKLARLTTEAIQGFYTDLASAGLGPRRVRYVHAVLSNALGHATKRRMIRANPCDDAEPPRIARREMRALSPEEAKAFVRAAEKASDRLAALWILLLTTGVRPGEALALKWSDIEGGTLRVQRSLSQVGKAWRIEEPKTSRARRAVPLTDACTRALAQHRKRQAEERLRAGKDYSNDGLVFSTRNGGTLLRSNLTQDFKAFLKRAELPAVRMYDLRHTCATLLLAAGVHPKVVQERLGHSSITLTMDVYSHTLEGMQAEANAKLDAMLA